MNPTRVLVAGGTGYSGQELLRLLEGHPAYHLVQQIGRDDLTRNFSGRADLAFLCTPNEISLELAPALLAQGISVVDVSGAFRLKRHSYPEWYGFEHTAPEWLERAEYALYPWCRPNPWKAGDAPRLIANPGCFPTAALALLLPALRSGLVSEKNLVLDGKSGTTGAGRKAETRLLFSEVFGEFAPYKVGRHQHWPEIVEAVSKFAAIETSPMFITELLPLPRGISMALFGEWTPKAKEHPDRVENLLKAFCEAYSVDPCVRVGTEPSLTSLKAVVGTNRVHIQIQEAFGRPVLFSVIDNLQRGAAAQALMNANQLTGRPAFEGLE